MNISRRQFFIGGAAFSSLGAFAGNRFILAAAGAGVVGAVVPLLRFGVVSDIHVRNHAKPGESEMDGSCNELTFIKTLQWFRDAKVDAVAVAGDMADGGTLDQLECVAAAWNSVFPGDKAPDGRKVERLFVYGNHDMGGVPYARSRFKGRSDAEIAPYTIYESPWKAWEETFHEPFEPIWTKQVKGYRFIGAHWWSQRGCKGRDEPFNDRIADWYEAHKKEIDPALPFFHIQHPHPKDTCYGSWAWGHDTGATTKALSAFPNAIAFSGHSHYALTDERSVWQGAFTSVGTGSLRYVGTPGREFKTSNLKFYSRDCRTGMLWSVYADRIVAERREFVSGLSIGEDWVLPLPSAEPRPFAFAERAKKFRAPQFRKDARLSVSKENKGGDALYVVTASDVAPDPCGRLFRIEFTAQAKNGRKVSKNVIPDNFGHSLGHKKTGRPLVCRFTSSEIGDPDADGIAFAATPLNCFGARGKALTATFKS